FTMPVSPLISHLLAKSLHVGHREGKLLARRIRPLPGPLPLRGIDRDILRMRRRRRGLGRVACRESAEDVTHGSTFLPDARCYSGAAAEAGREIAVDLDQRLDVLDLRADLQRHGLAQNEDAEVGDVLSHLQWL